MLRRFGHVCSMGRQGLREDCAEQDRRHLDDRVVFDNIEMHSPAHRPSTGLAAELRKDDGSHNEVIRQNMLAQRLMNVGVKLLKARLRSLSWYENGYPGSFAKLLIGGQTTKAHLSCMQQDWHIWNALRTSGLRAVSHLLSRSPFNLAAVNRVAWMPNRRMGPLWLQGGVGVAEPEAFPP